MPDNSNTYYINENENIFEFFAKNGIEISKSISKQIAFISNKTSNNYIGFYQFLYKDEYVKFYIIPKIYKAEKEDDKEELFISFLSKYYTLKNKYPNIKTRKISGNIRDIIFEDDKKFDSAKINDFLKQKYLFALKTLDHFFRKHNKKRKITTHYSSQTLEHKLNLRRSVTNINKSLIHQIKEEEQAFSKIAFIAEQALLNFKKEKVSVLEDETLIDKTNSILNTIHKKYKTRDKGVFKDREIIRNKIAKLFKKSNQLKEVYEALLIIIGLEHYKSDEQSSEIHKIPNMTALFFRPEQLYEWIVYDKLVEEYGKEKIQTVSENKLDYNLISQNKPINTISSEPDFVVIDNDIATVVDAKWKILDKVSDIQFNDIAKLERDYILRKKQYPDKKEITACLIYPKIDIKDMDIQNEGIKHCYNNDFEFIIDEIAVD